MTATTHPRAGTGLEPVLPGLLASPAAALPFGRRNVIRAFLLERDHGNLLVYSAPTVLDVAGDVEARGGIGWQYLAHWHEAMFGAGAIAARFGAPVVVHAAEYPEVAPRLDGAEPVTFGARHALGEGFEIVPTPGHTPGATAFLWEHGDHRFLFSGDTILVRGGQWRAAVLESSDPDAYAASLELLRDEDFDVLVPWVVSDADWPIAVTDRADAQRRIGAILQDLRRGGTAAR